MKKARKVHSSTIGPTSKGRPLSATLRDFNDKVVKGAISVGGKATDYLEDRPKVASAVAHSRKTVAKGARKVGAAAARVSDAVPDGVADWAGAALDSAKTTAARASRAGLSAKRVVDLHKRKGHEVEDLADVRRLDLKQVDKVGRHGTDLYYPGIAALSGAGTGLVISGGQLVTVARPRAREPHPLPERSLVRLPPMRPPSSRSPREPSDTSPCCMATTPKTRTRKSLLYRL